MRSSRCLAVAVIVASAWATTAQAARPVATPTRISNQIVATWTCQTQLGVERTQASYSPWALGNHSPAFRSWLLNTWILRHKACLATLHARAEVWSRLHRGLSGTPMAGTERELEAAGRRYHVSPFFIAGIAGTESSFGAAACGYHGYNAWGLANCDGSWSVPQFTSWAQAYEFMARFLAQRWPNASTTYDYHGYAACSSCWGAKTAEHMAHRFGVSSSVRYEKIGRSDT